MSLTKQIEQAESELIEKLANIEHIRWSKWQSWVHNRLQYTELIGDDGNKYAYYLMTTDDYERWERQINTDYQDLTESEKESDRREVRSYLPLLTSKITEACKEMGKYIIDTRLDDKNELHLEGIINKWFSK